MSKKIIYVVVGIIVLVGVFYGGMVYGRSQKPAQVSGVQTFGQNGAFVGRGTRGSGAGSFGGGTVGQIIAKDATSITVSIPSGGSKIIFLNNSTPITKQTNGALSDLAVGTEVSITGSANADGSISAQTVRITPKTQTNPSASNTGQ